MEQEAVESHHAVTNQLRMISNFSLKQHFQFSLWSEVPGWVISTPSRLKRGGVLRLRSAVTIALRLCGVEALWNPARLLQQGSLWRVNRRWLPAEVKNKSPSSSSSTLLFSPQHLHLLLCSFTPSLSLFTHRYRFLSIALISSPSFFLTVLYHPLT